MCPITGATSLLESTLLASVKLHLSCTVVHVALKKVLES